ncbi:MAG: GMP synthase subunit A [Candidatus Saliniplasma sp.]
MKIDVVDNGGQWTHREWRVLKYLDVDSEIIKNDTAPEDIDVNGLILSGGAPRISDENLKLGRTDEYLEKLDVPILGICVGAQFIAGYYGGDAGATESPEYGKTVIKILDHDDLFLDIPSEFVAWESHNDEIKELGSHLVHLATSESCEHQAFKHKDKRIYGLQFHPEVDHTEYGVEIFKNFIKVCEDQR